MRKAKPTMNKEKTIYDLKLHEDMRIDIEGTPDGATWEVIRVPGGWLYHLWRDGNKISDNFVPYNNEFID